MNKKPRKLSKSEITKLLKKHPHWKLDKAEKSASITVTFNKHVEALVFIARTTVHTEVLQHHPKIVFTYCKVVLTVSTHETDSLTAKDVDLIERIDHLLKSTYGEESV